MILLSVFSYNILKVEKLKYLITFMVRKKHKGFTLIEVLLVVALISILAGIVIIAVNPGKQLADGRNTKRKADVSTILNALYQYSIDNNGHLPATIHQALDCRIETANEICRTGETDCGLLTNLSPLTDNQTYLPELPLDPSLPPGDGNSTGYFVYSSTNNRITVCAPAAERGAKISVTR